MNDKYILILRRRNIDTDSDEHISLGTFRYESYAHEAALVTQINKREFLIVSDIADMHDLGGKNVFLYAPNSAGNNKLVGNYKRGGVITSNWLGAWEECGMTNCYIHHSMLQLAMDYRVPVKLITAASAACLRSIFDINDEAMSKTGGINCLNEIDAWCDGGGSLRIEAPGGRSSRKSYKYLQLHKLVDCIKLDKGGLTSIVGWCEWYGNTRRTTEMHNIILSKIPTWVMLRAIVGNTEITNTSEL